MRRRFSASLPPPGILTLKGPAQETALVSRPSATSAFVRDANERVRARVCMAWTQGRRRAKPNLND